MSEPEIARRCSSCGASIREGAFFCPQCGKELARQLPEKEKPDSATTAPLVDVSPEKDTSSVDGPTVHSDTAPLEPSKKEAASSPLQSPAVRPASLGKVRGKIQRATTIARDVEGDVIHRVQKVREISSVVLDEAGYDPSLRFVLVAAALFGLFLLILLLNKLIG